ncbi:MAG: aminotransferase class I/II-fold pyridoxal phosphate-dependent enzyme [Anaerovoracaceae bacterium]
MQEYILAAENGRKIPKEDKIFGISRRAKEMISKEGKDKVVNATIGALLDDDGKLIVLSSVDETFKALTPIEYAEYAPIGGTPNYKKAAIKAALGKYQAKGYVEAIATPGGTGAIRNTISNYSLPGDKVLTSDWHWSPYNTIAQEIGRTIDTYQLFNEKREFNIEKFTEKVEELLVTQERLVIIINTPAHNPTGYSLSNGDWTKVVEMLKTVGKGKKIALLVDAAYIDFAGDEDKYREFLPIIETLPENILPIIAYSMSKTYTLYGMRCGAMICLAKTAQIAEEFKRVCEFSSRGSWSNCAKASQSIIANIFNDEKLLAKVDAERSYFREMLIRRGKAFEEEANKIGLEIVPFDAGFFASIPCDNPDEISAKLEKQGLFLVPLGKGIRVSIASISEEKCRLLPKKILEAMSKSV